MDNNTINDIANRLYEIRTIQERNENPEFEKEFTQLKNNLKKQFPKKHKNWNLDSVDENHGKRNGRNAIEAVYSHKSADSTVTFIISTKTANIGSYKDGHLWYEVEFISDIDGEYLAEGWIKPKDANIKNIKKHLDEAQNKL